MSKQSTIDYLDFELLQGDTYRAHPDRQQHAPNAADAATDLEVLFALQIERLTPGSNHVGGRFGAIVRCPRCQRSACFIGGRRYAHGVRLIRQWTTTQDANGDSVPVLDVHPEWESICVGGRERAVTENAELFAD